jgi:hypothetical protein
MKTKRLVFVASAATLVLLACSAVATEVVITSQIESRIEGELPSAKDVQANLSLIEMPMNIASGSIRSANIFIESYFLKGSGTDVSLDIEARNISKKKPTNIGSIDITATIPASTILDNAEFENAEIVDGALQVSMGPGGLGQALLVPKFADNQIYFELESVSFLGGKIPASSLPANIKEQVKSKSVKTLDVPQELKIKSVAISPQGLSIRLAGSKIQLGKLGLTL